MFRSLLCLVVMMAGCGGSDSTTQAVEPDMIRLYRLRAPGDAFDLEQASGLCCGRIGRREGLWVVCDRHGGASAGKVFFYSTETLDQAAHRRSVIADAGLPIVAPSQGWVAFTAEFQAAGNPLLTELRRRVDALDDDDRDAPSLDLEAVTIGRLTEDGETHLFVANEEPYSSMIALRVVSRGDIDVAEIVGVYRYDEREGEYGTDRNDGLEGLAYAGHSGVFCWAEEGTAFHGGAPGPRLFFLDPRLERGRLDRGVAVPEEDVSRKLTTNVRGQRQGSMQTLNGLAMTSDGHLAVIDRNGGWILKINTDTHEAKRWLNLYDLDGVNLREVLDDFPGKRRMPYVSIEGIAFDREGDLWLVDDPAMPENFRNSCLLRVRMPGRSP